jgi:hypothetical protein
VMSGGWVIFNPVKVYHGFGGCQICRRRHWKRAQTRNRIKRTRAVAKKKAATPTVAVRIRTRRCMPKAWHDGRKRTANLNRRIALTA